jgi:hypothetical protein
MLSEAYRQGKNERPDEVSGRSKMVRNAYALFGNMRVIFVPHTGHAPCAAFDPFFRSLISPSNDRFSRHFTQ